MQQLILIVHVLISIFIIALVLIQHGKGADIGAAFGSGASQTIFGSQGSGSFLMKLTATLGLVFFVTCLSLGYFAGHSSNTLNLAAPVNNSAPMNNSGSTNNSAPIHGAQNGTQITMPATPAPALPATPQSDDLSALPGTNAGTAKNVETTVNTEQKAPVSSKK